MTPVTRDLAARAYLGVVMKLRHFALAFVVFAAAYFTVAALASPTLQALL